MISLSITISAAQTGQTLAAVLRQRLIDHSWSQVRRLIEGRRVQVGGEMCLDAARRLRAGDVVEVRERPERQRREQEAIVIRYVDRDVVVVEKPAGLATVRHTLERDWPAQRRKLTPTLEDLVPPLIVREEKKRSKGPLPRVRVVHRLDKETSGLMVFARTVPAERELGRQFHQHTVIRRYLAIIPGSVSPRRVITQLVRDRGDGRRGSTSLPGVGRKAVTQLEVVERLRHYSLISCRLETGRTHQIRIHLAELGHPLCGEKVYNRKLGGEAEPDPSGAPRLALHACELGFVHPTTGQALHWEMALPADLQEFWQRLRREEA